MSNGDDSDPFGGGVGFQYGDGGGMTLDQQLAALGFDPSTLNGDPNALNLNFPTTQTSGVGGVGGGGLNELFNTGGVNGVGNLSDAEVGELMKQMGMTVPGPDGSGGGAGGGLGSILKALGLGGGADGGMNWPLLMSLLAAGAGGIMNKNATSKATDQILSSIKDANTQVGNILGPGGGAQQSLQPYLAGGAAAMQAAPGMIYKAPGAQFSGPMDARVSIPPISLSAIMKRGR
jgi:hypothetical protein